jgi:ribosomal protein S1
LRKDSTVVNEERKMTEEPRIADIQEAEEPASEADSAKKVVRLSVGQELTGKVKQVTDFGAFVDIGAGRDGLVHISELSVGRVTNAKEVVEEGQSVTVWIKRLNRERNRISLTMISPDTRTIRDLQEGEVVEGVVTRMVAYGAFIDIGVGTDALLHVREMGNNYVEKPEDVVEIDEKLDVRIMTVNRRRRHIDVSIKGLRVEPEGEEAEATDGESAAGEDSESQVVDKFENIEVLSPMELAFKRAMEAGGEEVTLPKSSRRRKRRQHRDRSEQAKIIQRTLDTMRE